MFHSSLFYCFHLLIKLPLFILLETNSQFLSSVNFLISPFIHERYFHLLQDLALTILFFQLLKNIAPFPSNLCGFWWEIHYHSNSFSPNEKNVLCFSGPLKVLSWFLVFRRFIIMCLAWISVGLSGLTYTWLCGSVGLHLLPYLGDLQSLIL